MTTQRLDVFNRQAAAGAFHEIASRLERGELRIASFEHHVYPAPKRETINFRLTTEERPEVVKEALKPRELEVIPTIGVIWPSTRDEG